MFKNIKTIWQKFKKWIIIAIFGGTALAVGLGVISNSELKEITIADIITRNKHISVFQDQLGNKHEIIITKEEYNALGKKGAITPQYNGYKYLYSSSYVPVLNENEFYVLNKEKLSRTDFDKEENVLIRKPNEAEKKISNLELIGKKK